jgi:hypothetical protein
MSNYCCQLRKRGASQVSRGLPWSSPSVASLSRRSHVSRERPNKTQEGLHHPGTGNLTACAHHGIIRDEVLQLASIRGRAKLPRRQMRAWERLCRRSLFERWKRLRIAVLVVSPGEGGEYAEANVPAEETEEKAQTWIPGASVEQGRTKDP